MTPDQALKQVYALTEAFVRLSLSNEQNFPATHGNKNSAFEITVSSAAGMSVALKNVDDILGNAMIKVPRMRRISVARLQGEMDRVGWALLVVLLERNAPFLTALDA